nr:MAG TPA: hypothetical protein [Caudoviricetes sp.]
MASAVVHNGGIETASTHSYSYMPRSHWHTKLLEEMDTYQ